MTMTQKPIVSSPWSTQNTQTTLLLVFHSKAIQFKLIFAEVSPAEHIGDNNTPDNELGSESYKLAFAKRRMATQKGIRTIK